DLGMLKCHPARPLRVPGGIGQHRMNVKLWVEIPASVVHEHRTGKIAGESKRFGAARLATPFTHRGEVLPLREDRSDRFDEGLTYALVLSDDRKHTHVLWRRNLDVEERHARRLVRSRRQTLSGLPIAVIAKRLERRIGHRAFKSEHRSALADPLAA